MNVSVLVMSCDSYSDLWESFFYLKNKYWNCPYKTYLVSETKDCEYAETIKTIGSWTSRLRQALEKIDSKYVILLLEDFFIQKEVNQKKIEEIIANFGEDTAVYNLEIDYQHRNKGFRLRKNKESYLNSCQPSIHDRLKLIERLDKEQSAWEWELSTIDSPYKFYINTEELIFDIGYYEAKKPWAIVQGKISDNMINLFNKEGLKLPNRKYLNNNILLTIIIPYYKTLEYTEKLMSVLIPQLNNNVEVILIDDGCNEKELDKYSINVIHKENGGVSSARNKGLDEATGKYIGFIDSDDLITNNYIETILNKINSEDFDYCYISWKNNQNKEYIIKNEPPEFNKSVWNCIYKKELIGKERFKASIQYGEDWDFNNRVRKGKKTNIEDILYIYNVGREDSLTDLYCKGKITSERPLKAQIVMFLRFVSKIGGVEDFLYEFFKEYHDKHDILFLYEESDPYQLRRYKRFVKCKLYRGEKVECETYINVNCNKNIADNVIATSEEYLDMCHTDYDAMGWKYTKHPKTTMTICVSEQVKKAFLKQYPKEKCEVIYNILNLDPIKKALFLISGTRLSWEKGYDRMKMFTKRLNELKKPFVWLVFTNDYPNEEIDGFIFMKPRYNVMDYIVRADYYMVMSNTEACSMSNLKALATGIPIISTNYPSIYEQGFVNEKNGYILEMDMSNMDEVIEKMYSKTLKYEPIKKDVSKQWNKYLGNTIKSDYIYQENEPIEEIGDKWIALRRVKDDTGMPKEAGEEIILKSTERIRILLDNQMIKRMEE